MNKQVFLLFGLVVLAAIGALLVARSTPYGLGLVNDSAAYIGGAMNLLEGKGYARISGGGEIKPITHFPPFYSILLAGIGVTGIDIFQGARLFNSALFALSVILVGLSVYKISASPTFAILGAFLLAISDVHLEIYALALSEPLFLNLMLAAYLLLAEHFEQDNWLLLALSGFVLGLAYLTRYAGISLWITALLTIILMGYKLKTNTKSRSARRILVLFGSGLPLVLMWFVIGILLGSGVGNRQIAWHPVPLNELFTALKNLITWVAPDDLLKLSPLIGRILSGLSLLLLPISAVWLTWRYKNWNTDQNRSKFLLAFILGLHSLVYMAFLVFSISVLDASIPLNDRLLSVLYLPGIILFASSLGWLWRVSSDKTNALRWSILVICGILIAFSLKDGLDSVAYLSREGVGFTNRGWRESPALQVIKGINADIVIYSDRPTAIFLLTGRSAYTIPTSTDPVTAQPSSNYGNDLAKMHQAILSGRAVLVLFDLNDSREPADTHLFEDLTNELKLQRDFGTVTIYGK